MALPNQTYFGLTRRGIVDDYDDNTGLITVVLTGNNSSDTVGLKQHTKITVPYPIAYNNGLFMGAKPKRGTPVSVVQGEGNEGYFVQFHPQGKTLGLFPKLNDDEIIIAGSKNSYIKLDTASEISIGNQSDYIKIKTPNKQSETLLASNIDNEYKFSQGETSINSIVRREYQENKSYVDSLKFRNDEYDKAMFIVGMDPNNPTLISNNSRKNPPFVESRTISYEFAIDAGVEPDLVEQSIYGAKYRPSPVSNKYSDRRNSRANTLNLNIYNTNAIIEEIRGTVIDIFGNILDINHSVIDAKSHIVGQNDNVKSFIAIKEAHRKSLASHIEFNSRKDPNTTNNYTSNDNFGRHRSNYLLDIDKEGQFKLNVPASSENGNIGLLTRQINASVLTDEPSSLIISDKDILLDTFAASPSERRGGGNAGVIRITRNDNDASPIDRITEKHIGYGTAYHDILDTGYTFQSYSYATYLVDSPIVVGTTTQSKMVSGLFPLKDVISPEIKVGVNAGGRSGAMNFDGCVDVNIGANTVDKQSIILDTQGGIIGNVGKDLRDISFDVSMDGAVMLQVGGGNVSGDPRFVDNVVGGVVDIRVVNSGGETAIFRFDNFGLTITTPARMNIHSGGDLNLTSASKIQIDAEILVLQGRYHHKEFGGSS
jgi:hypothetical protein